MILGTYVVLIIGFSIVLGFPLGTGLGIILCLLASGVHRLEGDIPYDNCVDATLDGQAVSAYWQEVDGA